MDFIGLPGSDEATKQRMAAQIREIMLTKTRDEWFREIAASCASVAPCLEIGEVMEDPQVAHRGLVWDLEHPRVGAVKQWGFPISSPTHLLVKEAMPLRQAGMVSLFWKSWAIPHPKLRQSPMRVRPAPTKYENYPA